MFILISLALLFITLISSLLLSFYSLRVNNIPLLISSLSVIGASISGLIATMVLKANKDKERPFIIIKPTYKRYGVIQISVENYGKEIAIITRSKVDKQIKLLRGESFFEQINGIATSPKEHVTFDLILMNQYKEFHKNYTTKGIIYYKDTKNKEYNNRILFNIEKLGPTPYTDDEERKMFYELQKIPKELEKIQKIIKKATL